MASIEANKASKDEKTLVANAHINNQANAYLQTGNKNGLSRQNSRQEKVEQQQPAPFGRQISSENRQVQRRSSLKHSDSGYKLERKVSFHHRDQIIGDENGAPGEGDKKEKKKRTKEEKEARKKEKEEKRARKEAKRAAREASREPPQVKQPVQGEALLQQVSSKLASLEQQESGDLLGQASSSSLFSSQQPKESRKQDITNTTSAASVTASSYDYKPTTTTSANYANGWHDDSSKQLTDRPRKGPAPQPPVVNDLVNLDPEPSSVVLRDHKDDDSRSCSKRNSLDNKSVASLAKDLAAECAKAYELMESSLSKLTNDFSIGPFGLTPKMKKKKGPPPAPTMS